MIRPMRKKIHITLIFWTENVKNKFTYTLVFQGMIYSSMPSRKKYDIGVCQAKKTVKFTLINIFGMIFLGIIA